MTIDSEQDIVALQRIGAIVADALLVMQEAAQPGMTTAELDAVGAAYFAARGARSAPQLMYKFPGATCISINEEVAHGIPGERVIEAGDLINVDVSAELDGYYGDTGGSFMVDPQANSLRRLCDTTRAALDAAIAVARAGRSFNVIGQAISDTARKGGFKVIRNLCSHGVGRSLHEDPEFILPYPHAGELRRLHEGQVITIEPFLSTRASKVSEAGDGWTLRAPLGNRAAQYEHTMVITRSAPIITTLPSRVLA